MNDGASDDRNPSEASRLVLAVWGAGGLVAAALLGVIVGFQAVLHGSFGL